MDSGYREVVISGINLGRWGRDLSGFRLPAAGFRTDIPIPKTPCPEAEGRKREADLDSLIRAILAETALEKLRISSVEPMDWTDELISLVASSTTHRQTRPCPAAIRQRCRACAACIANIVPGIIARRSKRFAPPCPPPRSAPMSWLDSPAKPTAEFEATRRMIEDLPFTYLHVFTYSARPGTPAASMLQSSSNARSPRAQPYPARIGSGEKLGIHAQLHRQDSRSDHPELA